MRARESIDFQVKSLHSVVPLWQLPMNDWDCICALSGISDDGMIPMSYEYSNTPRDNNGACKDARIDVFKPSQHCVLHA